MNPQIQKLNEERRIAVESGRDPYAGNLSSISNFNSSISSGNLGGTPYKLPDATVSTNAEGITGASQAVIDQQKVNDKLAQDTADREAKATSSENTIKGLFDQTAQLQQQRAEAEGDVNISGTPANLKETARRATNALTVSQRAQTNELRALEGAGLTDIQRNQKSSEINRRYAFQQADLQLTAHLANSDYLAVEDTLNKKLELDLAPIKSQLEFQTQFYNNNRADLTKAEDRQLSQLINQTNEAVKTQEANRKAVNAALLQASQNGVNIPPNLFAKASNAKDVGELTQLLASNGISLQDPLERQLKQAQINSANRANQPDGAPSGTILTDSGKPMNDAQATSFGYAQRLVEADATIKSIGDKFTGASSLVGKFLPNIFKSSDRQLFEQSQRNFINAVLRKESGAVISEEEFANAKQQYFPQPGDNPEVLQQKQQNRNTVISNFYRQAGTLGQQQQVTRPEDLRAKYQY